MEGGSKSSLPRSAEPLSAPSLIFGVVRLLAVVRIIMRASTKPRSTRTYLNWPRVTRSRGEITEIAATRATNDVTPRARGIPPQLPGYGIDKARGTLQGGADNERQGATEGDR